MRGRPGPRGTSGQGADTEGGRSPSVAEGRRLELSQGRWTPELGGGAELAPSEVRSLAFVAVGRPVKPGGVGVLQVG